MKTCIPEEWELTRLEQLASKISDGIHSTPKYADASPIHFINGNNLKNGKIIINGSTKSVDEEDAPRHYRELTERTILMSINGTIGSLAFYRGESVVLGKSACYINVKKKADLEFVYCVLSGSRVQRYYESELTGSTIRNLSIKSIKNTKVHLPPLPEQKAIADLLSTWDEAIEKTERLVQAKEASLKGQTQRIMGKEAIEANGWLMVHLGELFSEVTRKVGEKELTPYSISAGIGFVSQREKWGKDISGSQHKNYTHLKAGEFSYNKGNSKRYKQGCVYLLKDGEICVPNVFIT
jgi:type I restriction enzyme, S subunit